MQNSNSVLNYQSILDLSRKNWLTTKEVIKQTGISRKRLLALMRSGVIPKPVIRMSETSRKGSRKNGYFPKTIVERIKMVKKLQHEGHPMEVIAAKFIKKAGIDGINGEDSPEVDDSGIVLNIPVSDETFNDKVLPRSIDTITVSLDEIRSPAILVDSKFNILWRRKSSPSIGLSNIVTKLTDSGHDNLIEVFLYSDIKHQLTCWKKLLQYFAFNAKIEISKDYLNHIYPEMSDNVIELFCTTIARDDDNFGAALESGIALPEISCLECDFSMTCLHCREGSLYVFHLLKDEKTNQLDHKEAGLGRQDVSKVSVCGLCAQLHNAEKIEAQMLPAEYYQLLKRVWDEALKILKKHNGTILSGNSNQMQCYFPETENETKHIQNAIKCALALAKNSRKISLELKKEKGWTAVPMLSVGISLGSDLLPPEKKPSGIVFSIPGGALDEAEKIAGMAGPDQIWAVKNVIGALDPDIIKTLSFGIKRDDTFIQSCFSRVRDLESRQIHQCDMEKIGGLSVTQILPDAAS